MFSFGREARLSVSVDVFEKAKAGTCKQIRQMALANKPFDSTNMSSVGSCVFKIV